MVRVEGREGRQPSYAIAVGSCLVQPLSTEETSSIKSFCCPECKEDFGSNSNLNKHKKKYDIYDNILEDLADIQFKLIDRIGQFHKDMDGEGDSEHEDEPKKEFNSEEKINQLCHNTETEKLQIEEKCLECSICHSTFCWQKGLRANVKSMLNENSIVSNVSGALEALRNLNNSLISFINKTLTSLKYYKNLSVISVIGVV